MAVTLEDVGRHCGVSRSTVSRVINKSPLVNEETKERVMKSVKALKYAPNFIARSLTRNRTDTLAVTLPDISGGVFPEMLAGMDEVAGAKGCHLLVVFLGGVRPHTATVEELITNRRVDAVVSVASTLDDQQLQALADSHVPLVCVARKSPVASLPSVLFDNHGGALKATRHLLERGRTRLIHIRGPRDNYDAEQRLRGYHTALRDAGQTPDPAREFDGGFSREGGAKAMLEALNQGVDFDGLFAANDDMAVGAMEVLTGRGKSVPDDVAVIGFDDIDLAHYVGLSTIRVPLREMGRAAVRMALQLVEGAQPPETEILPIELVRRASTMPGLSVNALKSTTVH